MPFNRSPARALAALSVALLLQACAGFVIHDEERSKLAADTKQSYVDAKVTVAVDADRKNLEFMLAAELEVVRENARYEADWASLALANDITPMGRTVVLTAQKRIDELGLSTRKNLRAALDQVIDQDKLMHQLTNDLKMLATWKIKIPDCARPIPASPVFPKDLSDADKPNLQSDYNDYVKHCNALLDSPLNANGKLKAAHDDWKKAQLALDKGLAEQEAANADVKKAKEAYDKKVKEATDAAKKGQDLSAEIADKAKKLAGVVEDAKKLDKGLESEPFIDALVDLLTATAGGDVDPKNPELQGAVAVAKQIPSLAGDIVALEAKRAAPPVAGLLLELRHQTLQAEMTKQRAALARERVAILKEKRDIYLQAADRWLRFFDATCNYAVLGAGQMAPGDTCDSQFSVKALTDKAGTVECYYADAKLPNCLLDQAWKDRLRANEKPEIKRQLYAAVAAYLQALTLQVRPLEQSFKEIDVRHRETLLSKKTAIDQWDNIVSVPLDQLEAYYKAGVKPAELADLIVKALGFTAIAIGVSK
jgi:hypothetical protein